MKLRGLPLLSVLVVSIAACANSHAQTNTFVVPQGMDAAFGKQGIRPFSGEHPNFEQIYSSHAFVDLPTDAILITELAFRVDENQKSDTDRNVSDLFVAMNTTRRSLEEIASLGSSYEFPRITVYQGDLRMKGRVGITNAFDIRIPLQTPFLYDRRKGQFVVVFGNQGYDDYIVLDSQPNRLAPNGLSLYSGGWNLPTAASGNLIIELSYITPPKISGIRQSAGEVELTFDFPGVFEHLRVEASPAVNGPYKAVTGAVFTSVENGKGEAKISVPDRALFFRIHQTLP